MSDLGQMDIDPRMITYGDNQTTSLGDPFYGTFNANELQNMATDRNRLAETGDDLESLSRYNKSFGLNPTSGMGIMDSFKHNLGGSDAQRSYANTANIVRRLMNLSPITNIGKNISNSLFGTDFQPFETETPEYDITDRMEKYAKRMPGQAYDDAFFEHMLRNRSLLDQNLDQEQQERYNTDLMDNALFGPALGPTQTIPKRRPEQPTDADGSDAFDYMGGPDWREELDRFGKGAWGWLGDRFSDPITSQLSPEETRYMDEEQRKFGGKGFGESRYNNDIQDYYAPDFDPSKVPTSDLNPEAFDNLDPRIKEYLD